MEITLAKNVKYNRSIGAGQGCGTVKEYKEGQVLDVNPADNLPDSSPIKFWIVQDEWEFDTIGFGLYEEDVRASDELLTYLSDYRRNYSSYNHSIRGYDETPEIGQDVSYSDVKKDINGAFFELPIASFSDYGGDTVNRANFEHFKETFESKDDEVDNFYHEIYGGHNSNGILIPLSALTHKKFGEELSELILGLQDYPLFDDESLSHLESELEQESWDSWVRSDLEYALERAEVEYDEEDAEKLEQDFWTIVRLHDIYFTFDDAVSAHIDIDKVVEVWGEIPFCPSCEKELFYFSDDCETCPRLF